MIVPSSIHHNGFKALSRTAQVAYYYLATYANAEGRCWPGQDRITQETGITHKPLVRALKELEAAGWIFRWIGTSRGHSTVYQMYTKGGPKRPSLSKSGSGQQSANVPERGVTGTPPSSNEQTIRSPLNDEDPPEDRPSDVPSRENDSWERACATG